MLPTPAAFFPGRPPPPLASSHTAHSLHAAILMSHPPCHFPLLQPSGVGGGGRGTALRAPRGRARPTPPLFLQKGGWVGFASSASLPFLTSSRADSAPSRVYHQGFSHPGLAYPRWHSALASACSPQLKFRGSPQPSTHDLRPYSGWVGN